MAYKFYPSCSFNRKSLVFSVSERIRYTEICCRSTGVDQIPSEYVSIYIYFLYRGLSTYVGLIIRKLRDGNGFGNKPLQKSNH